MCTHYIYTWTHFIRCICNSGRY
uniref:Uncharacterized protein n=1 Tax=Schistosoma japonicum TaxID=6182 RepID=Q5BY87_SCHJA|nr:unknown [Schistosoma japonicum]